MRKVGGEITKSSGGFFFVCTIIARGVTALFSVILSAHGLWVGNGRPQRAFQAEHVD